MTKEEKESLRKDKLIENLEAQVELLEAQNQDNLNHIASLKSANKRKEDYNHKLVDQLNNLKRDWVVFARVIRIVKATTNGVYIPGEDQVNTEYDIKSLLTPFAISKSDDDED